VRARSGAELVSAGVVHNVSGEAAAGRVERGLILKALDLTKGNVTQAARHLKISRKSMQTKMKELGLRDDGTRMEEARARRADPALPAKGDRLRGEVDARGAPEAAEGEQVEAGPAARVEEAGRRPRPRPERGREQGGGDRPLACVPPLGLLRLEHPAVLGRLHRRVASEVK
jgi:hypothetical protein